jgi:hypothetical protein
MFVQLIETKGGDPKAVRDRLDTWVKELGSGAEGWLGSTAGFTSQGGFVMVARFESEDAARRNSDRPEQGEWWQATEKLFSDPAVFTDYPECELFSGGGSDTAGFVQIIKTRTNDTERLVEMGRQMDEAGGGGRGDVIGGVAGYNANRDVIQVIYFTSEAEARENESKPMSEEMQKAMAGWAEILEGEPAYLDITEPWMWSA